MKRSLVVSLTGVGLSVLGFALFAHTVPGLVIFVFLIGSFAGACSPAIQTRLMDVSFVGVGLAVLGFFVLMVSFAAERLSQRRSEPLSVVNAINARD